MTSVEQTWIRLQTILPNFKLIGTNQAKALCPSHDDKSPSLSISKTEHFIQLNCFAGCTYKEIVAATGMKKLISVTKSKLVLSPLKKSAVTITKMKRAIQFVQ